MSNRPVEFQANSCFINLVTGTFVRDQPSAPNMKVLVLTEMSARMLGCALVGTSADHTSKWIRYWMNAIGLTTCFELTVKQLLVLRFAGRILGSGL